MHMLKHFVLQYIDASQYHPISSTYVCTLMYNCLDEPLDLLVDYFKKFGHKPCCFDDTHIFITKLLSTADADKVGGALSI